MKIYLIKREDDVGYDEYAGFVVAALTPPAAKELVLEAVHASTKPVILALWADLPVKYLGRAAKLGMPAGIILSDFNAG